jgi:hypothetical protein
MEHQIKFDIDDFNKVIKQEISNFLQIYNQHVKIE